MLLSSILFQDLVEKAGSIESFTLYEGDIPTPGDDEEENVFEVICVFVSILFVG